MAIFVQKRYLTPVKPPKSSKNRHLAESRIPTHYLSPNKALPTKIRISEGLYYIASWQWGGGLAKGNYGRFLAFHFFRFRFFHIKAKSNERFSHINENQFRVSCWPHNTGLEFSFWIDQHLPVKMNEKQILFNIENTAVLQIDQIEGGQK